MKTTEILNSIRQTAPAEKAAGRTDFSELLENSAFHISNPQVDVFVVFTDSGYWGLAKTLPEAKKRAKVKSSNRATAYAASDDVTIYDSGRITASMLVDLGVIQEGKRR